MSSNIGRDYLHRQLPVREFAAWLVGGVVGLYAGARVGLMIEPNLGPVIGSVSGWLIVGRIFACITRHLFRSVPKMVISVYAAQLGFIGIILGTFISDFIAVKTNTSRLVAIIWGPAAGLIAGTAMGIYSTKRRLKKEGQNTSDQDAI